MVYDKDGNLCVPYSFFGKPLLDAFNVNGRSLSDTGSGVGIVQEVMDYSGVYCGGLVEIQPDSWDGTSAPTDATTDLWGFPMSLSAEAKSAIKSKVFANNGRGVSFIRFPMGFGYRGYRNIDARTGLARNIGERWGQNEELRLWFDDISAKGGGLDVEYWCYAPHWLTGGAYYNPSVNNEICAGGSYPQDTPLRTIKASDPLQYNKQIAELTDAIIDDLEYLHESIAPVRLFSLLAEPEGSGQLRYGHCHIDDTTYYDVFAVLYPKILASSVLSTWNGQSNKVRIHAAASDETFRKAILIEPLNALWGYSHDFIRYLNGEYLDGLGADYLKSTAWEAAISGLKERENIITCEYEYFGSGLSNEYRFANNVVRMIFELVLNRARIIMPIIHICKPKGQTDAATNTAGYCLYAVDMDTGAITPNAWAYNSWLVFNDNLPIGATLKQGGDGGLSKVGYGVWEKGDQTFLIAANYSDTDQTLTIELSDAVVMAGKLYDLNNAGTEHGTITGKTVSVTVPAYSALVYSN